MTVCPRCQLRWGRSDDEHNLLFGVVGMAFDNWPESYEFQPATAEQLRGWLAIMVGHSAVVMLPKVRGLDRDGARRIADIFTEGKEYYEAEVTATGIRITRPKTMKKKEIHIREFRAMANNVYEIIESITGITPESYKANKDKIA